jgi:hypothetical protein
MHMDLGIEHARLVEYVEANLGEMAKGSPSRITPVSMRIISYDIIVFPKGSSSRVTPVSMRII